MLLNRHQFLVHKDLYEDKFFLNSAFLSKKLYTFLMCVREIILTKSEEETNKYFKEVFLLRQSEASVLADMLSINILRLRSTFDKEFEEFYYHEFEEIV